MPTPRTGITGNKTAKSPRNGAEMPTGAHPKNTGGKKGRSGRKPQEFKAFAVSLARDPAFQERLRLAAIGGDLAAMKLVIQYAEGMPTQPIETRDKTAEDLARQADDARTALAAELARLRSRAS